MVDSAPDADLLTAETLRDGLRTRYVGRPFVSLAQTDSTQNVAAQAARRGEPEGLVVSADRQSAGRGRFRRSWVSPTRASLLVSVLLRPPAVALPSVVMLAALAVARAVKSIAPGLEPQIKWPNDVLLKGRKVCGILVETTYAEGDAASAFTVLGIGLNVNWDTSAVPEIADTATSMSREAGRAFPRRDVLQALLWELEQLYDQAKSGADILSLWRRELVTLGRRVRVQGSDVVVEGVAMDVDSSGALLLRTDDGRTLTVHAGDVTLSE